MAGTPAIKTDHFAPGELIAGKYTIERVIGVGGVGLVLAARHTELDETVAIKFLLPEMQERPDIVGRFAQEAKAAVRIKSEYAARVYDVGADPLRGPYLVMEYLDGRNLGDVLENGTVPLKRAVEFMLEVCEALAVAHSNGIIHRDIKPENLFLSRRGDGTEVMKILDFGISKAALTGALGDPASLVKTQELMGTPLYMSPEQIRSTANVDHRSDIWSLGVVFYEMLTCQFPFPGDTIPKICAQVLEAEAPPLSTYISVPEGLQEVMDRCFQKDPAKRFQNVAEFAIALLPFGPSRAAVYAERASSILEASGKTSGVTFRFSSAPPPNSDPQSVEIPSAPRTPRFSSGSSVLRSPTSSSSLPTAPASTNPTLSSSPEALDALARESRRTRWTILIAAVAVIVGLAGAAASFVFGAKRTDATASAPTAPETASPTTTAPPTAPTSSTVTIALAARPSEAKLFLDDAPLGANPYRSTLQRDGQPHSVRAEAPGYQTRSVAITFDSDKEVVLALDKTNAPPQRHNVFVTPLSQRADADARKAAPEPAPQPAATNAATATTPPAPTTTQPAPKGLQEVDLPKTKKQVRPVDTAAPW